MKKTLSLIALSVALVSATQTEHTIANSNHGAKYSYSVHYFPMFFSTLNPVTQEQILTSTDISSLCQEKIQDWKKLISESPSSKEPFLENLRLRIVGPAKEEILINYGGLSSLNGKLYQLSKADYEQIRKDIFDSLPEDARNQLNSKKIK